LPFRAQMQFPLINPLRRHHRLLTDGMIIKPLRRLAKRLSNRDEAKNPAQAGHAPIILQSPNSHKKKH
ncbi:uncharacterized protein METZ01_LOCUS121050, partial [marine metagenome]